METKYITHRQGETFVLYDARLVKKPRSKRKLSFLFLNLSLIGILLFLVPILIAELKYRTSQISNQPQVKFSRFGQLLSLNEKGILSPADWNFSLIIPKISLNIKVESAVDPGDKKVFQTALKTGVAHAKGTAFPDESGTVFIFGHSTDYPWNINRYSAHFYPLQYLNVNEEVIIVYQGKNYLFRVKERKVAEAEELEYLVSQNNEDKLVLQTCWPPGTTWKRLIIVASPVREI